MNTLRTHRCVPGCGAIGSRVHWGTISDRKSRFVDPRADEWVGSVKYRLPPKIRCTLLTHSASQKKRKRRYPGDTPCDSASLGSGVRRKIIFIPSNDRYQPEELKRLLARLSVIRNPCDLDLLVFLHRHPRTLLTNEQIAAFVGYDKKQVAKSLEAFIEAGLLERTQNPMHAARMYLLELDGPNGGGYKNLLELASTRAGRRTTLNALKSDKASGEGQGRHLRLMKRACA